MAEMKTDSEALAKEAGNFGRIAEELKSEIDKVTATAEGLKGKWQGQAGTAADQAIDRFVVAGKRQQTDLDGISTQIKSAGVKYEAADQDQAGSLASQMNF